MENQRHKLIVVDYVMNAENLIQGEKFVVCRTKTTTK